LLNIPPARTGKLHANDVNALLEWRKLLDKTFAKNLAQKVDVKTSSIRGNSPDFGAKNLVDGNKETYWSTDDNTHRGSIEINLGKPQKINFIMLQEFIKLGQRVKGFTIEVMKNNKWKQIASATTIGYKRIVKIDPVLTKKIRINITGSKACPVISNVEVY